MADGVKWRYDSTRRRQQAGENRRRILGAAHELFVDKGLRQHDDRGGRRGCGSCRGDGLRLGYFVSGRMKVVMDGGEEMDYGPGDVGVMAPGHDAWIVGDEPCVVIEWQGFADYAKR